MLFMMLLMFKFINARIEIASCRKFISVLMCEFEQRIFSNGHCLCVSIAYTEAKNTPEYLCICCCFTVKAFQSEESDDRHKARKGQQTGLHYTIYIQY